MNAAARVWILVLLTIAGLALALILRNETSIWRSSGGSAVLSLALVGLWFPAQFGRLVPHGLREAWLGIGGGIAMALATWLVYPLAARALPGLDRQVAELYRAITADPGRIAALPLLAAIVVAEECVFRGVLMDSLLPGQSRPRAVAAATAIYTVPQIASGSWVLVMLAIVCGAVWSTQRARSGRLAIPFIAHLLWDVLVFVIWPVR